MYDDLGNVKARDMIIILTFIGTPSVCVKYVFLKNQEISFVYNLEHDNDKSWTAHLVFITLKVYYKTKDSAFSSIMHLYFTYF